MSSDTNFGPEVTLFDRHVADLTGYRCPEASPVSSDANFGPDVTIFRWKRASKRSRSLLGFVSGLGELLMAKFGPDVTIFSMETLDIALQTFDSGI